MPILRAIPGLIPKTCEIPCDLKYGHVVLVNCTEGFGGYADIIGYRSNAANNYLVYLHDGSQRPFWAYKFEIFEALPKDTRNRVFNKIKQLIKRS